MPGSLARPPQHEHRNKGEEIKLTGELAGKRGRRSWRQHRRRSHGCGREATVQRLRWRGAASCSRPSGQAQHLEAMSGLQAAVQPMRRRRATASTERLGQKLQRGQPEQIKPRGQDPLGEARSDGNDWRRGQRIPTVRWKHTTRWSDCAIGQQRSSPESGEGVVGVSRSLERGLGLGHDRVRERVRGRPAGPSWSDQAHSG
jgi:hypothetical protein